MYGKRLISNCFMILQNLIYLTFEIRSQRYLDSWSDASCFMQITLKVKFLLSRSLMKICWDSLLLNSFFTVFWFKHWSIYHYHYFGVKHEIRSLWYYENVSDWKIALYYTERTSFLHITVFNLRSEAFEIYFLILIIF